MFLSLSLLVALTTATTICPIPVSEQRNNSTSIGICPADIDVFGPQLQPVFSGARAPTGIAVSPTHDIFFTYARNMENQTWTLTKATSYTSETPWPSEEWQNCKPGQDVATCFVNVQNVVLDDSDTFWVIDSGVPNGANFPLANAAKILTFNHTTGALIKIYIYPPTLYNEKLQLNDLKINNTLGYAFITEDSNHGSITTLSLSTGTFQRHIYNTTYTRPDDKFVSMYNGRPIRNWKGTVPSYMSSGSNGVALAGGMVYWGVKSSHRYYYAPQTAFLSNATDAEIEGSIEVPGNLPSEGAGFTADDRGRVYMMASEQNAILYIDTLTSETTDPITSPISLSSNTTISPTHVPADSLIHYTLVRSGQLQAADTACILDGWMYVSTNQQGLAPLRQYGNVDRRKGPFLSYRIWIGRGPA